MPEINSVGLDIGPVLGGLERIAAADATLRSEQIKNRAAVSSAFATSAAESQVAFSNSLSAQQADLRATSAAIRSAQEEVKRLTQAQRELEVAQKKANDPSEVARLAGLYEKNKQKILEAKAAVLESKDAADKERQAIQDTIEARRQATNQAKLEAAQVRDVTTATKQEAQAAKEAGAEIAKAAEAGKEEGGGSAAAGAGGGFFGSLLGKLGPLAAGLVTVNKLIGIGKEGLNDYAETTSIQNTFKAVAGSAGEGAKEYAFVKQRAADLGLELNNTAKAYTGLFAASKESNFSIATTREIFEGLTAAGTVLGRSQAQVEQALTAVEQMISKGTVSSQELKLQLGNALPGAFGLAARAAGLTTSEFTKQLETGKILANDFLPKFARVLKDTYGNSTADAAEGVRANMGRISTYFQETSAKVGAFLAPAVAKVAEFVSTTKRASEATAQEQVKLEESLIAITSLNVGNTERTRLIQELQREYPALLGNINAETVSNQELSKSVDKVSESLVNRILVEKEDEKIADQAKKTAEAKLKRLEAEREIIKQLGQLYKERNDNVNSSRGVRAKNDDGSIGLGVNLKQENQGLPLNVAAQNTVDLISAQKVAISTVSPAYEKLYKALEQYKKAQVALNDQEDESNRLTREKAEFLQLLGISTTASTAALGGNTAALSKSIDALKAHRAEVLKSIGALQTTDYDDPKYRKKLTDFEADVAKTDALIKELEGKQDKSAIAKENKAKAALEAYQREQQTYKELTLKAAEQQATDAKVASEKQLQLDLTNIYEASRKLLAAKKKAGQGNTLDATQTDMQGVQIQGAYKADFDRLLAISRTKRDQLIGLEAEGDQKERDQLEARFQDELEQYKDQADLIQEAKEKHERDLRTLNNTQANRAIDKDEAAATQDAISDVNDSHIQDAVTRERAKQEAILNVQLEYAAKRLKIAEDLDAIEGTPETHKAVVKLKNDITDMGNTLNGLKKKDNEFNIYKFIFGNNYTDGRAKAAQEVIDTVVNTLGQTLEAEQQAAAQRVQIANQNIQTLSQQLAAEVELHQAGSASNIKGLQDQIAEEKTARREALEEQRTAAKEKVLLDTATQISSLITASAEIFAAFAPIPIFGIPLAIGAIAIMTGAFAAAKISAYQQAGNIGAGYFKGGYTGGNGDIHEERGPVHAREFVFDNEKTSTYRQKLFEPLHQGRPQDIKWDSAEMRALLPVGATILLPDVGLADTVKRERAQSIIVRENASMEPLRAEMKEVRSEVAKVTAHTARLESIEDTATRIAERKKALIMPDGSLMLVGENGSTHRIYGI
ncbi:MAG: tape measure protein [Janthinobacterium lividum]